MNKTTSYDDYFDETDVQTLKDEEKQAEGLGEVAASSSTKSKKKQGACTKSNSPEPWVVGGVFVLIGGALLFSRMFGFGLNNWWALFLLIPAGGALSTAVRSYQKQGRWSESASGSLFVAGLMVLLTAVFIFNLSWSMFWPVLLILLGLKVLIQQVSK